MGNFYDKVGKKFGGYAFGRHRPKYLHECPDRYPEEIFKEKLLELASKKKIALDAGCGDGKFAYGVAKYFSKIIGIDNSKVLLNIAHDKQKEFRVDNVIFQLQDARQTSYDNETFDVVYCRRGPSFYKEYHRVLKKDGYYVEIGIGEKDTADLKRIFGRGQGFGEWNESRLARDENELKEVGFSVVYAKEIYCNEYYPTYGDLDLFLQGVPIFEDYDSVKDRKYLEEYCQKFQTDKGIRLERHRVVYVAQK